MDEQKQSRRRYTNEFKRDIVQLYQTGKKKKLILSEYNLSFSLLNKWIKKFSSDVINPIISSQENEIELNNLRIRNKQLEAENAILKEAVLMYAKFKMTCN